MLFIKTPISLMTLILVIIALGACDTKKNEEPSDQYNWSSYLGGDDRNHYAPLSQINLENVSYLQVAWEYDSEPDTTYKNGQIQCNPLIIDGVLFGTSPTLKIFALDAATGKEIWMFDHQSAGINYGMNVNRGLVFYENEGDTRIYFSAGPFLYALNAKTGELIESFGEGGKVSLREGLGRENEDKLYVVSTTPGVIYEDLLIIGFRTTESAGAAPGHIRAYDVNSGEIEWIFHTIPKPGEFGYETWPKDAYNRVGGANAWAGLSLDEDRGIVYIPTGSAAFDFYGGNRKGENLFANTLLALDASTGERIWHYQIVRHDLWDRDLPAPPNLVTINRNGKKIDAIAQITKHAYVYLFDRETGEPIFPIEEREVKTSTSLVGEEVWPTQPFPSKPAPFGRQQFTEVMVSPVASEKDQDSILTILKRINNGGQFEPPSLEGTMIFPGFDGGGEWGGAAVDPDGIMYVNSNEMPWILTMIESKISEKPALTLLEEGAQVYSVNCAMCHGQNLKGDLTGAYPSLENLKEKMGHEDVSKLLEQGRNMMPAFGHIPKGEKDAVIAFLLDEENRKIQDVHEIDIESTIEQLPYTHTGYHRFLDSKGYPVISPPWGTLNAIDLNKGEILWQVPLGELEELTSQGIPKTGTENYGGPVVTASGLIFIAASKDEHIRAFDKKTGEEVWKHKLPAGGYATPATYMIDGKQYLVIACGGGKMGTKPGSRYVAFALP